MRYAEEIKNFGGLHVFSGWQGPIITDSGGFQIFSMGGHGSVSDEIKRRGKQTQSDTLPEYSILESNENGLCV